MAKTMQAIWQSEFQQRRKQAIASMVENSVLIWPAAPVRYRNADTAYPYRQDSDFYYLTGFEEPEALLVLHQTGHFTLFCQDLDPVRSRWEGSTLGPKGARTTLLADEAYAMSAVDQLILELLSECSTIYYPMGLYSLDQQIQQWISSLRANNRRAPTYPVVLRDARGLIAELRVLKSPLEISQLTQAARLTAKAYNRLLAKTKPGLYEYQLEAMLLHEFYDHGARACAYPSIVGGGANSCILHYHQNQALLQPDTLVLVDAGCEWAHYASDVTRTFPVTGRFNAAQRSIYELVLEAQLAGIEQVRPGTPYEAIQKTMVRVLSEGLKKLGFLDHYKNYYMHGSGHWLGLDVHDVGAYEKDGQSVLLQPGMVLTIEPGLYFAPEFSQVPAKFRGIGIRIEDDIVVTEQGMENLNQAIPKTIADIEQHMQKI